MDMDAGQMRLAGTEFAGLGQLFDLGERDPSRRPAIAARGLKFRADERKARLP
ncbi:hypothetical protein [Streptomyces sp. NBC_00414]|uniref:hypothetical protein n=1 Tax=Streptomyces sp. NBC_00414 TaxID=2975739 RepID=UPI003FA768C4